LEKHARVEGSTAIGLLRGEKGQAELEKNYDQQKKTDRRKGGKRKELNLQTNIMHKPG